MNEDFGGSILDVLLCVLLRVGQAIITVDPLKHAIFEKFRIAGVICQLGPGNDEYS